MSQDDNAPSAVGEPFEHCSPSHFPACSTRPDVPLLPCRGSLRHYRRGIRECTVLPSAVPRPH
ncbi:hypothetical protein Rrhod_3466 [Rhodococcus rhodnii LMG 5362]|uniref:Uncharacterized protein n=1 Tax=Rhodococcus rhodnii LMG 5362 TaxID=1273125 RepID=R7WJ19_9NOCA|nr:hypothetical protein Rrhod_3466 [Rhodococcus rhodnii LMG 5362]